MKQLIVRSSCYLLDRDFNKRFLPAASVLKVKGVSKQVLVCYELDFYYFDVEYEGKEWTFKVTNAKGSKDFTVRVSLKGVLGSRDFSKSNVMNFESAFLEEFPSNADFVILDESWIF